MARLKLTVKNPFRDDPEIILQKTLKHRCSTNASVQVGRALIKKITSTFDVNEPTKIISK